jgi:glycosyltransferase involved in cell wall biosynthesis
MKKISLVIPFFNEEKTVESFFKEIRNTIKSNENKGKKIDFEFLCIDDGSIDNTLKKLIDESVNDQRIKIIEFSRNFGKEAALTAGIDEATGDAIIPIDSDLQDPPELIFSMIEQWEKGYEVVLAKRENRESDSFLKKNTAELFYKIHNYISPIKIPRNVGDFRLLDRLVVDSLKRLPENQRFMKGLFAWIGFKTCTITYTRPKRIEGHTKFNGIKLINLAVEGITSFSTAPLRFFSYIGLSGIFITSIYAIVIILRTLILGVDIPGYASLIICVLFFGNLQLIGIGIIGEYLGRTYIESKKRPIYIIRKKY